MDPTSTFCPNLDCPARGQTGQGNTGIHSRKDQRFRCRQCGKSFAATKGTPCYRLRTPAETVTLVVTWLAHGCPLQAIVAAFGFDERTVAAGLTRAGLHSQAVHEHVVQTPRDLGQGHADEIRVKTQGGVVWMALAMLVSTRLWRAGEVSEHRDLPLIRRLIERVRACALPRALLCCTAGWCPTSVPCARLAATRCAQERAGVQGFAAGEVSSSRRSSSGTRSGEWSMSNAASCRGRPHGLRSCGIARKATG